MNPTEIVQLVNRLLFGIFHGSVVFVNPLIYSNIPFSRAVAHYWGPGRASKPDPIPHPS